MGTITLCVLSRPCWLDSSACLLDPHGKHLRAVLTVKGLATFVESAPPSSLRGGAHKIGLGEASPVYSSSPSPPAALGKGTTSRPAGWAAWSL